MPETQVRFGPACAGAAERPQARRAPATADNDMILVDNDVTMVDIDMNHETSHLLSFIVTCQFGSVAGPA
jgi:hypothetical protein